MTIPDIVIEDEAPKPSFYEKYVAFGQKYKTPLYCIGAAGVAFAAGRTISSGALSAALEEAKSNLEGTYHEIANLNMDLRMRDEFIDVKKLGPKFAAFVEEYNGLPEA